MHVTMLMLVATLGSSGAVATERHDAGAGIPPAPTAAPAVADSQQRPGTAVSTPPSTAPHSFAVGASLVASNRGAGGTIRYWFNNHFGVDTSASYYRGPDSPVGRTSMVQVSPSAMYLFSTANPQSEVNLRPYVGAGFNYSNYSRPIQTRAPGSSGADGMGGQVFGGAELSFKNTDRMTLSGELNYVKLPNTVSQMSGVDGVNFIVAVHFYLK